MSGKPHVRLRVKESAINDDMQLRLWLHKRARESMERGLIAIDPNAREAPTPPGPQRIERLASDNIDENAEDKGDSSFSLIKNNRVISLKLM